jgi:hypothetical protein
MTWDPVIARSTYMAAALRVNESVSRRPAASPGSRTAAVTALTSLCSLLQDQPVTPSASEKPLLATLAPLARTAAMSAFLLADLGDPTLHKDVPVGVLFQRFEIVMPELEGRLSGTDSASCAKGVALAKKAMVEELGAIEPLLASPVAAYNAACVLLLIEQPTTPSAELHQLLARAFTQGTRKAYARRDPFFTLYVKQRWFLKLAGPDTAAELEEAAFTRPYADALKEKGIESRSDLRARVATAAGRVGLAAELGGAATVGRLVEWDGLLQLEAQLHVPGKWLDAFDEMAIRTKPAVSQQDASSLHEGLGLWSRAKDPDETPPSQTDVQTWILLSKH